MSIWTTLTAGLTLEKIGLYLGGAAFIFILGFAFGQHNVTKTAIDSVQTHADAQFAAATGKLAAQVTTFNGVVAQDAVVGRKADDGALALLQNSLQKANADLAQANAKLAKEKLRAPIPVVSNGITVCPKPDTFSWDGNVRRVLDHTSGADTGPDYPPASVTKTDAPGRTFAADAPAATTPDLSPGELIQGYSNLGKHDQECVGRLHSLQDWVTKRLVAAP